MKKENLEIKFGVKSVDVKIDLEKQIILHMNLSKEIIPESSIYKITQSTIELYLKKAVPNNWDTCEVD